MNPSLEEERRALLEQIAASRAIYRRMLTDSPTTSQAESYPRPTMPADFPRSQAIRWIKNHPWLSACGLAALLWLGPGRRLARRARAGTRSAPIPGKSALKGIAAMGALLMRNRASMQALGRIASMALSLMRKRRAIH